jgi:septal ring factor EnvC (AmiA/AmiB activator)
MKDEERELKLGNIADLNLDEESPEETPAPAPRRGPRAAEEATAAGARSAPVRPAAQSPAGNSIWMGATAFLLVLVVVLGVWFFRQLSALQAVVDNRLAESTEQLGSLASQLSATDESVTQSSDQVRQMLANHDSEIRKLWDVANKRNRGWIEKNQADIAQLTRQRAELNKSVEALKTELATLQKETQQLVQTRNQLQTRLEVQAETVKQLDTRLAAQQKQVEALNKLLPAMQSLARVDSAGGGIANRLTEIEAAINAFDTYRRQVNVRLDRLDGGAR